MACKHIHQSIDISDDHEIKVIAKKCFENLGKTVVEFMQFPRMEVEKLRKYVKIEGVQHVENAIAEGNGVILITGHFGNWELLAASISALVAPVTPIVRELRSRSLNSIGCQI